MLRPLVLCALALCLCACSSDPEPQPQPAQPQPAQPQPAKPQPAEPEPARPPASQPVEALPAPKPLPAKPGQVVFTPQPGWTVGTPTSPMRKAQFTLPGEGGDLLLVIYHFGSGKGGTVEANMRRWIGQFEQPDGKASKAVAKQTKLVLGALTVHRLELNGTYVARVRPTSKERQRKENSLLLAAVIEGGHGPYFVKLVGSAAQVGAWKKSFDAFLAALRVAK